MDLSRIPTGWMLAGALILLLLGLIFQQVKGLFNKIRRKK